MLLWPFMRFGLVITDHLPILLHHPKLVQCPYKCRCRFTDCSRLRTLAAAAIRGLESFNTFVETINTNFVQTTRSVVVPLDNRGINSAYERLRPVRRRAEH